MAARLAQGSTKAPTAVATVGKENNIELQLINRGNKVETENNVKLEINENTVCPEGKYS